MAGPAVCVAQNTQELYKKDYASFQQYSPAQQELDPQKLDTNLLAVAVFHETNHRRKSKGFPALSYDPGAQMAAALQAKIMAEERTVSHRNPNRPGFVALEDRLEKAGLNPRFAAENVASAFDLQYDSGRSFYKRLENGRTIVSYTPNGKPIPQHTYLSFAKSLLDQWMNSPGHRKNILHPDAKSLGASCVPGNATESSPMRTFYCVQVFYTPLR